MKNKHLMIDLETLSTRHDAAILSIGAAFFDLETGEIDPDTLHIGISLREQPHYGHIDPKTIAWWLQQPKEAQTAIENMTETGMLLTDALAELRYFVLNSADNDIDNVRIWSNGATFDIAILEHAYQRHDEKPPWRYWNHRDVRTLVEMGRLLLDFDPKRDMPFNGTRHDALADAIHQAKYVSTIFAALRDCVMARP